MAATPTPHVSTPAGVTLTWPVADERPAEGRARIQLLQVGAWLVAQGATNVHLLVEGTEYGETHVTLDWTDGPLHPDVVAQIPHQRLQAEWRKRGRAGDPAGDRSYRGDGLDIDLPLPATWGGMRKVQGEDSEPWVRMTHRVQLTRRTSPLEQSLAWLLAYGLQLPNKSELGAKEIVRRVDALRWDDVPDTWWRTEGLARLTEAPLRYSRTLGGIGPAATHGQPPAAARPWLILRMTSAAVEGYFGAAVARVTRDLRLGTLPPVILEVVTQHLGAQMTELADRMGESSWSGSVKWVEQMVREPRLFPYWSPGMIRQALLHEDRDVRLAAIAAQGLQRARPATTPALAPSGGATQTAPSSDASPGATPPAARSRGPA